jgi:DNA-binding transcriptional LysR family regulator
METADFRTLIAVVEYGSITRAAEALHRVPSAITNRLQQLEKRLGVQLFLRSGRRMALTKQGRDLYDDACRIVALIEHAQHRLCAEIVGGKFRLGAMDSMAATRLPLPLAELYRRHPNIALELTTGISGYLIEALQNNQLDAAFIADVQQDAPFERVIAFEEKLVIIAPASHCQITHPCDIGCSTALVFADGCSYRSRFLHWFNMHGVVPDRLAVMSSYHAILGGVAAGMGVGIVPEAILATFPDRQVITVHPVADLASVATELLWKKGHSSANIDALKTILAIG